MQLYGTVYLYLLLVPLLSPMPNCSATTESGLRVYEYYTDLFAKEPVPTEFNAYKLLKCTVLPEAINYLAVPWVYLINTNQLDRVNLPKLQGGFTICQHIHYEKIISLLRQLGIDTLFTPHVDKEYEGIRVLPFPCWPIHGALPAQTKDIWYSFVGANTHWVRRELFSSKHPSNSVVAKRKTWHFWSNNARQMAHEAKEYKEILARSRFSLCPRGTGASTIRFWESLQAGAIPVVLADAMRLPIIQGINWEQCIIRIPEKDVKRISEILASISPEQEQTMRIKCLNCFEACCSSRTFIKTIEDAYSLHNN